MVVRALSRFLSHHVSVSRYDSVAPPFFPRVITWLGAALLFSLSPILLLKHLRALNFVSFLAFSRSVRSFSRFLYFLAASLAVFPVWFPFCFRVPLISYPARNDGRFRSVFEIWRVFLAPFSCFSFSRDNFPIKITLIFKRSRPVLSNPVPPTRLPALYYL